MKTVLFGPFIGEFGWELAYWHGWVRRACRTVFKDYHKVAASFPGRYPFYPDADKFLGHPQEITGEKFISNKAYVTDNWFAGLLERGQNRDVRKDTENLWEGSLLFNTLVEHYRKRLPDDVLILSPTNWIDLPDLPPSFGTKIERHTDDTFSASSVHIRFQYQKFEPILPGEKGQEILRELIVPDKKLIALFPRARLTRRPDKNWPKDKYIALIDWIHKKYPEFQVAILGEPGGAYFADGKMPDGCVDLINAEPVYRMDIQVAALQQATIAIGSQSGATSFAMACDCPTFTWGNRNLEKRHYFENFLNTSMYYYPFINPPASEIISLTDRFIRWHLNHDPTRPFPGFGLSGLFMKAQVQRWQYAYRLWRHGQRNQVYLFK